jgi:enoyl-CoA hydratase/carnithine racemase
MRRGARVHVDMHDGEHSVLYSVDSGVATLTLNRPDRLNAWTSEMEEGYFDLLEQADDDPVVRVIVVTGAGRGFCPGMDASVLAERAGGGSSLSYRRRPLTYPLSVRKVTIAAINGACAGIGLIQAMCCDVRFAASEAKIATSFTRRGVAPEFAAGWLLTRIAGAAHASDLLLSARAITGQEAAQIGLVLRALPGPDLLEAAYSYAHDVAANCAPRAIAYAKADLLRDWTRSKEQAEADAAHVLDREGHKEDFREGVQSYVEKRPAHFENVPPAIRER